jgi:hypothetical protein
VNISVNGRQFFNATKQNRYYIKPEGTYPVNLARRDPLPSDFDNSKNPKALYN